MIPLAFAKGIFSWGDRDKLGFSGLRMDSIVGDVDPYKRIPFMLLKQKFIVIFI